MELDCSESILVSPEEYKSPILPHAINVNVRNVITIILSSFFIIPLMPCVSGLFYTKALSCCINKSRGILNAPKLSKC